MRENTNTANPERHHDLHRIAAGRGDAR